MSPKVETSNLIISPMVKSASIIESLVLKNLRIEPGAWSKENKNKGVIYKKAGFVKIRISWCILPRDESKIDRPKGFCLGL